MWNNLKRNVENDGVGAVMPEETSESMPLVHLNGLGKPPEDAIAKARRLAHCTTMAGAAQAGLCAIA